MLKVRVNSKNQIVIPAEARKKLGIKPGDTLVLDVHDESIFVMREPDDHLEALRRVGAQAFEGIDGPEWLRRERDSWEK